MSNIAALLKKDFPSFVRKVLREWLGDDLEDEAYIRLVADKLTEMISGEPRQLVVNLPPRHLKTIICSQIFPAFFLGRFPEKAVMIVTLSDRLAREIASGIRRVTRSDWYKRLFPRAGVVPGRDKLYDF